MSALRTAAQGSQHTVDYAYGVNKISIVRAHRSCFRPYPIFTFCGEWVVYAKTATYIYCIAGNIGGELNLADWQFASRPPN